MTYNDIKKYDSRNHLPLGKLQEIRRRQDPLDISAGGHLPYQGSIDVLIDPTHKIVYKIGPQDLYKRFMADYSGAKIASQSGIITAKPLAKPMQINNLAIVAFEYIPHAHDKSPDPVMVGRVLASLHNIKPGHKELPSALSELPELAEFAIQKVNLKPEIRKAIITRALPCISTVTKDMAKSCSMVHGDIHLGNILPLTPCPALIDFENCGLGSPLVDIAALIQFRDCFGLDRDWTNAVLASWGHYHYADPNLLQSYVDWRRWFGVLSMIKRCHQGTGDQKELDTRLKWALNPKDKSKWTRC